MSERFSPGTVIKGIFGLQLLIGVALIAGDMSGGISAPGFAPRAPSLDQPVRPGDQTRRYQTRDVPDVPNRPFPATPDMPSRLTLNAVEFEGRDVLRLVGAIAPGDAVRIADQLSERLDDGGEVLLHSPGGSVMDAVDLGRAMRDLGLSTRIATGDVCLSACPYVFVGGAARAVDRDGSLGVHQHYFGESTVLPAFLAVKDIQRGQGQVMAYLDDMGVDPLMMQHALTTPPESIYIFVEEELDRYRLTTGADPES
ncbi:hypothetical protein PARPLA_02683 [Rhodobacteraceae bacterium THAF1]|uniref:COG3904 family protein n=1 Tax=Palleronia sp. THAF1 TaxID=2587842 RepID=UPI000F3DCFFE|nr:hypothetical protein [Palleronia sp. THAF1]QFU08675.1 hypothetical protein FIU81_08315 [Palleronia sp. THAF1]VDC28422.1 hypothetical protein PARPLA_02683 [Rhodobacteraceae bacterium THAF1]